ncbi:PucR family transcriptional regulator [Betaproteobacteria bacterium]|nr:PucR family transcriptional regulator [Betaproteobacteria bacterium]
MDIVPALHISEDSIDLNLARQIVELTASLFPFPTNICNVHGIMIASKNTERIGSYHEGAAVMIQNNWNEIIVTHDGQYKGSRKGVSHPIRFRNKTIGSIGLTGEAKDVATFSKLLQSFTELLVENNYVTEQTFLNERTLQSFVIRWLLDEHNIPDQYFTAQMQKFGFRWTQRFAVVVIRSKTSSQLISQAEFIQRSMHRFIQSTDQSQNIFISYNLDIIWITNLWPLKKIMSKAEALLKNILDIEHLPLNFGIGKHYDSPSQGRKSYAEALMAVELANSSKPVISYYDDIISIAFDSIPMDIKKECLNQVFADIPIEERNRVVTFVAIYVRCDGSINEIAKRLNVSKNTVQYRISKINDQLGFDIRKIENQQRLMMACFFTR